MARKIFKRTGLRRDKNFGDLLDPVLSLNNLLGAVVTGEGLTFINEDLNCIRNIFSEGIGPEGYQQFIGSSVKRTTLDGTTVPVEPSITYQNRLDYYETNSGEPRLNGGNGLTAKYFNSDQVNPSNSNIFVGVSTLGTIPNDNFGKMETLSGLVNLIHNLQALVVVLNGRGILCQPRQEY